VNLINIDTGAVEWPVVTSSVTAGWADGELAAVAGPAAFATTDKALKPEQNFGVQMVLSRKTLKQSAGIEDAVRRDMNSAIGAGLDKAFFLGSGDDGEPLGMFPGQATYGFSTTGVNAAASWSAFRTAVVAFMTANAANGPGDVKLLIRPEVWSDLVNVRGSGSAHRMDRLCERRRRQTSYVVECGGVRHCRRFRPRADDDFRGAFVLSSQRPGRRGSGADLSWLRRFDQGSATDARRDGGASRPTGRATGIQ